MPDPTLAETITVLRSIGNGLLGLSAVQYAAALHAADVLSRLEDEALASEMSGCAEHGTANDECESCYHYWQAIAAYRRVVKGGA